MARSIRLRWIASFETRELANDWVLKSGGKMLKSWRVIDTHIFRVEWNVGSQEWDVWLCERR